MDSILKRILYRKAYLSLYPLLEDNLFSYKVNSSEYGEDISALRQILVSEAKSISLDIEAFQRYGDKCCKTKTYAPKKKNKDKDSEDEIYKVKTVRRGFKYDQLKYNDKIQEQENYLENIRNTLDNLDNNSLNEYDIEIIKELLYRYRWNTKFQVTVVCVCALIFVILFMMKFF